MLWPTPPELHEPIAPPPLGQEPCWLFDAMPPLDQDPPPPDTEP